jgi:hypothetical protein
MNYTLRYLLILVAAAAMISVFTNRVSAQDEGRDERRQRMIDGYKETIGVKSEEDWKKIGPLVGKVIDNRFSGFGGFGGRGGGGGRGGDGNRGGQPNPERDALQKAIDDKASIEEIKEKLAKYRESRKAREAAREAALAKAQEELKNALSPRQEAAAVLAGLLR